MILRGQRPYAKPIKVNRHANLCPVPSRREISTDRMHFEIPDLDKQAIALIGQAFGPSQRIGLDKRAWLQQASHDCASTEERKPTSRLPLLFGSRKRLHQVVEK